MAVRVLTSLRSDFFRVVQESFFAQRYSVSLSLSLYSKGRACDDSSIDALAFSLSLFLRVRRRPRTRRRLLAKSSLSVGDAISAKYAVPLTKTTFIIIFFFS